MGKTPEIDIRELAKNHIRNSGLDFWQRFGPTKTFSGNAYIQDRWFNGATGPVLFERLSTSPPAGLKNYMRISYSASGTDNTNNFYYLEDIDLNKLKGKRVTFSILVRRSGTMNDGFAIRIFKNPAANTTGGVWTQIAITTALDSEIPVWTDSPDDWAVMKVTFDIPDDGTANGLRLNYVNTINPGATTFIEIAAPMLNIGSSRERWQYFGGSYDADLVACQRYYEKSYRIDNPVAGTSAGLDGSHHFNTRSSTFNRQHVQLKVRKRIIAYSVQTFGPFSGVSNVVQRDSGVAVVVGSFSQSDGGFTFQAGAGLTQNAEYSCHWQADAEF